MTIHNYTAAEMSPLTDIQDIKRRAVVHGYTGVQISYRNDSAGENYSFTFDQADDKNTTKTNLSAAVVPTLSLSTADLMVTGDGVATGTVTVSDSRGAGASGKVINMMYPTSILQLSPTPTATLDGSGAAVITFGPSPSAGVVTGKVPVEFSYATDEGAPITGKMSYV